MTNLEKYNKAFIEAFAVTEDKLNGELTYNSIAAWDSVGHMSLMAMIEDVFDIMFETEDIIDFSSYEKGKELVVKYGIEL